ncbi:hypothetical protein GCM10009759_55380 [Kitasatospora saccharophila]|uniref:Uncharacterized protein n=1 Tax=Kitasatospora saccharophila TaxID=407973 RepID=A0ABN2XLX1_9ACTN
MTTTDRSPREQLERALHVSFKLPEQARAMLDAYRDQVLAEATEVLRRLPAAEEDRWWDTRDRDLAIRLLLAARTGQEG